MHYKKNLVLVSNLQADSLLFATVLLQPIQIEVDPVFQIEGSSLWRLINILRNM